MAGCVSLAALVGCASTYQADSWTGGFSSQEVRPEVHVVSYYGNGYTTNETVQTYWLYRSAEIARQKGYDGFGIVLAGSGERRFVNSIDELIDGGGIGKPGLTATILLLNRPLPDRPGSVFDAQALTAFLRPYVEGEKCGGNVCPHVPDYLYAGFADRMKAPESQPNP